MEPLSWTGSLGTILNPIFMILTACLLLSIVLQIILSFFAPAMTLQANPDGTLMQRGGMLGGIERLTKLLLVGVIGAILIYIIAGIVMPYGSAGIIGAMSKQFLPVWIALILILEFS